MRFKDRARDGEKLGHRGVLGGEGTKSPPNKLPKAGQDTKSHQSHGSKLIKDQKLAHGEAADVGPAPAHRRLYMRDYSKTQPAPSPHDYVTDALGNPLKL